MNVRYKILLVIAFNNLIYILNCILVLFSIELKIEFIIEPET